MSVKSKPSKCVTFWHSVSQSSQNLIQIVQCVIPQKQYLWNCLYSRVQWQLIVGRVVRWETEPTYKALSASESVIDVWHPIVLSITNSTHTLSTQLVIINKLFMNNKVVLRICKNCLLSQSSWLTWHISQVCEGSGYYESHIRMLWNKHKSLKWNSFKMSMLRKFSHLRIQNNLVPKLSQMIQIYIALLIHFPLKRFTTYEVQKFHDATNFSPM
jgi:hypothetical protein